MSAQTLPYAMDPQNTTDQQTNDGVTYGSRNTAMPSPRMGVVGGADSPPDFTSGGDGGMGPADGSEPADNANATDGTGAVDGTGTDDGTKATNKAKTNGGLNQPLAAASTPTDYGGDNDGTGLVGGGKQEQRQLVIKPYIEVGQVMPAAYISGSHSGNNIQTDTDAAVGINVQINGNNNQGTIAGSYERQFGLGTMQNATIVSGLAKITSTIIPNSLRMDVGAFGTPVNTTSQGGVTPEVGTNSSNAQIWTAYAGPTLTTRAGVADIQAHYHIGYADQGQALEQQIGSVEVNPTGFAHSVVQDAAGVINVQPGRVAPVGFGLNGGWYQEDVSLLGQRIGDAYIRGSVSVPINHVLRIVGGIGYEHDNISSYNAQLDSSGNPILNGNGQYISDTSTPRVIAFDFTGLLWDVGVEWRPNAQSSLTAYYGRRYGSDGVWGNLTWSLSQRQHVNVNVYNTLISFGGSLVSSLSSMPADFTAISNPISGSLTGCVATLQSGGCLASELNAQNGAAYHDRGVSMNYGMDFNHIRAGFGMGYDRHEYISAPGTVISDINGEVSQYWWLSGYVNEQLSRESTLTGAVNVYRSQGDSNVGGNTSGLQVIGTYARTLSHHLTASASIAIDRNNGQTSDTVQTVGDVQASGNAWSAAAALNMRYTF